MVIYDLACLEGHTFEGWFQNLQSCLDQASGGQVACPTCGSTRVEKKVTGSAVRRTAEDRAGTTALTAPVASHPPAPQEAQPAVMPTPTQVREFLGTLAAVMRANSEDVGPRFAAEARKIHHREVPERMIRGTTTPEEQQQLLEEEIPFLTLPDVGMDD